MVFPFVCCKIPHIFIILLYCSQHYATSDKCGPLYYSALYVYFKIQIRCFVLYSIIQHQVIIVVLYILQYADHDGQIGWTLITLETQEALGTTNRAPPNSQPTTTSVTVATSPKWSVTLYPWRLRRNRPGKSWCVLPVKDSCAMTPITSRFRAGTTRSGIIVIVVRQTIGSSFINLL